MPNTCTCINHNWIISQDCLSAITYPFQYKSPNLGWLIHIIIISYCLPHSLYLVPFFFLAEGRCYYRCTVCHIYVHLTSGVFLEGLTSHTTKCTIFRRILLLLLVLVWLGSPSKNTPEAYGDSATPYNCNNLHFLIKFTSPIYMYY